MSFGQPSATGCRRRPDSDEEWYGVDFFVPDRVLVTSQPHRYVEEPAGGESGPEVPHSRNDHFHYGKSHVGTGLVEDEQLHSVGTYQRVRRFDVVP